MVSPAPSSRCLLVLLACGCAARPKLPPRAAAGEMAAPPATMALGAADAERPHCFRDAAGAAICPSRGAPIPYDEAAAAQMATRGEATPAGERVAEDDAPAGEGEGAVLGE